MPPKNADSRRDNFSAQVIRIISERSGGKCAMCRAPTHGPRDNDFKSINVGQAAHITAAAPNGPRYDHNMSPQKRSSALNGMWLCGNCHHIIDTNVDEYTVEKLQKIKRDAEADARAELGVAPIKKVAPLDSSPIVVATSANAVMEIRKVKTIVEDLIQERSQTHPNDLLEKLKYIDIINDQYLPAVGSELLLFYRQLVIFDNDHHTWLQVVRLLDEIIKAFLSWLTQNDIDKMCAIIDYMLVKIPKKSNSKDWKAQYESAVAFLRQLAQQIEKERQHLTNTAKSNLKQLLENTRPKRQGKDEIDAADEYCGDEVQKFQAMDGADEPSDWVFISTMCNLVELDYEDQKVKEDSLEEQGFITYVI